MHVLPTRPPRPAPHWFCALPGDAPAIVTEGFNHTAHRFAWQGLPASSTHRKSLNWIQVLMGSGTGKHTGGKVTITPVTDNGHDHRVFNLCRQLEGCSDGAT